MRDDDALDNYPHVSRRALRAENEVKKLQESMLIK